jgi:hypothetical protein
MKKLLGITLIAGIAIIMGNCSDKDNISPSGNARLEVRLTDDPAGFDAIYIDIQDVKYNVTGDDANGWTSLTGVNKGVYNLLDLVNDKDTLLGNTDIPGGRLHQLRLVLGSNNTIVVDGVSYPLETPSAQQSGLKLNIQQDIEAGILYTLLLDFDAAKSVVKTGNKKYHLKPVIRTIIDAVGGSIAGYVKPPEIITAVYAIQGTDTVATTFTGLNGGYIIKGVTPGSYDLHFYPTDILFKQTTINGITVTGGKVSIVDTVQLMK